MRGMIRRNRSADGDDLLPLASAPRSYRSGDEEDLVRSRSRSAPRNRRVRSASSDNDSLPDLRSYRYSQTHKDKAMISEFIKYVPQFLLLLLLFVGIFSFAMSTEHTASKVRGIYCPVEQPDPFSKCSLPAGTDCPFQCINMPVYDKDGCTGEVVCQPEKRCTFIRNINCHPFLRVAQALFWDDRLAIVPVRNDI
eukprot:scaffold10700_cov108-Cylindrotheca_fusiformis.AAC.4